MKKLILLHLICWSAITFGQNYFSKAEIVKNDKGGFSVDDKIIELKNGTNDLVKAELTVFGLYAEAEKFDFSNFDKMIDKTVLDAKYKLKTKSTFRPLSIRAMLYNSEWMVSIEYSGQNDYGATKECILIDYFDMDGSFTKQL